MSWGWKGMTRPPRLFQINDRFNYRPVPMNHIKEGYVMRQSAFVIAIAGMALSGAGTVRAAAPVAHYQPVIDITKDPGCGRNLGSREHRIAFNRRLAELYFINFQNDRRNGRNWNWAVHDCVAEGATVLLGTIDPLGEALPRRVTNDPAYSSTGMSKVGKDPSLLSGEQIGYFAAFPDWGTVPGTLVVVPFEGGAYFRMMYAGHGKDDGKEYKIWETNLVLVNDQGKITHFEMWNDSIGMDSATRKAFGHGISGMQLRDYIDATDKARGGQ